MLDRDWCYQGLIDPPKAGRGHAANRDGEMLKIATDAWAGGKSGCAVCVDLQAVRLLGFLGEYTSLAKLRFYCVLSRIWASFKAKGVFYF